MGVHSERDPAAPRSTVLKSREMDMRNRVTRLTLLPPSVPPVRGDERGVSRQPTASPNGRDCPRLVLSLSKQANAFGKAEGYADVGRVYGKPSATEG